MMRMFDPFEHIKLLEDDIAGYRALIEPLNPPRFFGPMATAALDKAAYCVVVGYDGPARLLLQQARVWLTVAIEADEQTRASVPRDVMRAERHFTLAWCNWLLDDAQDDENFALAFEYRRRAAPQMGARVGPEFDLSIVDDLNSALWQQVIDDFPLARITPAATPARVRREGQLALIVARHALGLEYDEADVAIARDALLKRNVNNWLVNGHSLYVMKLMKVFFWTKAGLPGSFETVRRAYDYLPGVVIPKTIVT